MLYGGILAGRVQMPRTIAMEDTKYYYNRDGENRGPVGLEELKAMAARGEISGKTPVIKVGTKEWVKWETVAPAAAGSGAHPAGRVVAPKPMKTTVLQPTPSAYTGSAPQTVQTSQQGAEEQGFGAKITQIYEKINDFLTRICVLPTGLADTPEQCEKSLNILNAPVGVGSILCVLCFILGNGLYESIKLTAVLLLAGCVVQYICYQLYRVMVPLLLGRKIKLSSMGIPWAVMMVSIVLVVGCFRGIFLEEKVAGVMEIIMMMLYFAGVAYVCVNARKLFVTVVPQDAVPGREMINHCRFVLRALFMALHVLTPLLMLISAVLLLANGHEGFKSTGSLGSDIMQVAFMPGSFGGTFPFIGIILPIVTLFVYCLLTLLPDIVEANFAAGDAKNKTSE